MKTHTNVNLALRATAGLAVALPLFLAGAARAEHGPMMHAAGGQAESEAPETPTVILSEIETWTEYRHKTDRTYIDEKGETQPLYELLEPASGHVYLRVVADVSSDRPIRFATDELLLVSGPYEDGRWEAAPLATFDALGLPQVGTVTEPAKKTRLDLLYEAPAGSWPHYYIEIGDRWYGPLGRYLDPALENEDATDIFHRCAESGRPDGLALN